MGIEAHGLSANLGPSQNEVAMNSEGFISRDLSTARNVQNMLNNIVGGDSPIVTKLDNATKGGQAVAKPDAAPSKLEIQTLLGVNASRICVEC